MITTYSSRDYRITYQGIALIENALERPDLVQVSVVSGCTILVAPQKEYGIDYEPNGEYRYWYIEGMNTQLARAEAHYIYARLNRDDKNALLLFSVNDYDTDGKINGEGTASEDYYYIKIGDITKTDLVENPTLDREITIDFGYLATPAGSDNDDGWRKLFEVTADDLIRPLKKFTSYIIQGTLDIVGKIVLNEKQVSDIARQGDQEVFKESDEILPTTKILTGKYLDVIRKVFLNKDREDSTDFVQTFKKGIKVGDFVPGMFGGGGAVLIDSNKDSVAEFDKMTIRKKAYFNTLAIMETELAGAEFLFNSSGARIKVTKVEVIERKALFTSDNKGIRFKDGKRAFASGGIKGGKAYRCYFLNDDGDTAVENRFHIGNFARSQTFNVKAGVHENVSNHYWWRLVTGVGDNYIEVSDLDCDEGSDIPAVGDVVVQLGDISDTDYQSAISLSAFGYGAPRMSFHTGINSYSMGGTDVFSLFYDSLEEEAVLQCFGRAYIGLRTKDGYFEVKPKENKLRLKGEVEITGGFNDEIAHQIGFEEGWSELVEYALQGKTIIKGGMINTELINAGIIITSALIASAIKANELNVNDKFIVSPEGVLSAKGANIKGVIIADSGEFNNGKITDCSAVNLTVTNIDAQGTIQTNKDGDRILISSSDRCLKLITEAGFETVSLKMSNIDSYYQAELKIENTQGAYSSLRAGQLFLSSSLSDDSYVNLTGEELLFQQIYANAGVQITNGYIRVFNYQTRNYIEIRPDGISMWRNGTEYEGITYLGTLDQGTYVYGLNSRRK